MGNLTYDKLRLGIVWITNISNSLKPPLNWPSPKAVVLLKRMIRKQIDLIQFPWQLPWRWRFIVLNSMKCNRNCRMFLLDCSRLIDYEITVAFIRIHCRKWSRPFIVSIIIVAVYSCESRSGPNFIMNAPFFIHFFGASPFFDTR